MNLPEEYCTSKSYFQIFLDETEGNVTYGKGASLGSKEILKASQHLEYYEDEFDNEPFEKGITVIDKYKFDSEKFIITLGGDHSVSIPIYEQLEEDVSVIVFDAHLDFRDSWNGSTRNHACVNKFAKEKVLVVGCRSMDKDEKESFLKKGNVMLPSYNFNLNQLKQLLPKLSKKVYVSIDVDAFDYSIIRNTGTPEPGGLTFRDVVESLKIIFQEKTVVGSDIVEFAPTENFRAEAFSLARLAYKIMALKHNS